MIEKNKQGFKLNIEILNGQGKDLRTIATIAQNAIRSVLPNTQVELLPLYDLASNQPKSAIWDTQSQSLMINYVEVRLNRMEQVIMTALANKANDFVTYPELLSALQSEAKDVGSASNLRVLVHRLRKKIGIESVIQTDKQYGYSLRTNDKQITIQ